MLHALLEYIQVFVLRLRHSSHENAIVPFHLRSDFWNGQIGCSHGNGTIACQYCFKSYNEDDEEKRHILDEI